MEIISTEKFLCDKNTTCCFTGHRNKDLPFGGDMRKQGMKCLVSTLQLFIEEAVNDGYTTFISGMADGIDLCCAEIVHNLKATRWPQLVLVCALPYSEQFREMPTALDQYRYSMLIETCDVKVIVSDLQTRERYKLRNMFMIENSSKLIGAYKEKQRGSGTLQTINMAKRKGIDIQIISLDKNTQLYIDTDIPLQKQELQKYTL